MLHTDSVLFHAIVESSQDPDPYRAMRYRPFAPTARLRAGSFLAKANVIPVQSLGSGLRRPLHAAVALLANAFQPLLPKRLTAAGTCSTPACC